MIVGCGAALVVALPLFLIVSLLFHTSLSGMGALLFLKIPILFAIVFGIVGFISPAYAADGPGKAWKGVIYVWRVFVGV